METPRDADARTTGRVPLAPSDSPREHRYRRGRVSRPSICVVTCLIAAVGAGCAASFRETPTPPPTDFPTSVPWRLNRELLTAYNREIVFVVEKRAGGPPDPRALDDLVALASRYGERPARWTMRTRGEPITLAPDVTYVVVEYVADQLPSFGLAYSRWIDKRHVYFIIINQEMHRRLSALIPQRRMEQQTLIHEYGHLLGLPPPDDGYHPNYPSRAGGMHCVSPDCPLARPRPKAVLYNSFHIAFGRKYLGDYCETCRAAIASAKAHWLSGAVPRGLPKKTAR